MHRLALAMGFVALGVLEFTRHQLEGILVWHWGQLGLPPLNPDRERVAQ